MSYCKLGVGWVGGWVDDLLGRWVGLVGGWVGGWVDDLLVGRWVGGWVGEYLSCDLFDRRPHPGEGGGG